MNQWLWKHLVAAGYDVSAAIDGCVTDFDQLDPDDQRRVIRAGLRGLLAEMSKRQKLTIPNGRTVQMPLFAAVKDGERWVRVSYLAANLDQLRQLVAREGSRIRRNGERLRRMRKDLALYESHPEAVSLEAVWLAEAVEYRIDEKAA